MYISDLAITSKKHSSFLQEFIKHIRTTCGNWKKHLFTCYDSHFLPNTNLALELSHSRMKRKHRKITGLKNSHHFMLVHGEHFSFCFDFNYSFEAFVSVLQSVDRDKLKNKVRVERNKSHQRNENKES